ncbi:MAG: glycosyltransferase family 4 protein [Candidatus Altiarchaeota archaeon]|nr:glycosyltransferase family 4 protein [Candidatus Altiarchaeota archaeon]
MNILITSSIFPPEIGGPATYAYEFSRRALELGHKVSVVTLAESPPEKLSGVDVSWVRRSQSTALARGSLFFTEIMKKAKSCDLIYAQNPAAIGLPSVLVGKILRKPVVVKYVGDTAWEKAFREGKTKKFLDDFLKHPDANTNIIKIQRYVFGNADRIITPSDYLKGLLVEFYKVPEGKVYVIPNAVSADIPKIRKSKDPVIITVARIVPWKGIQDVIGLMPGLLKKRPHLEYWVVGTGPYEDTLKKEVEKAGLSENVRFFGSLSHSETLARVASAHVFVLNSLYEGMAHVLLEAMAVGTPVVATDICGNPELIENGKNGFLVKPDDKEGLKKAVEELLKNRSKAEKFSLKAGEFVKAYNWDNLMQKTLKVLSA